MNSRNTRFFTSDDKGGNLFLKFSIGGFAAIFTLMFGLLAFLVVPAPNNRTAAEVSGILVSMSHPHPEYGDIKNVLDNRHRYYINRVSEESHLDWESRLVDVQPGDEIQLMVVKPLV